MNRKLTVVLVTMAFLVSCGAAISVARAQSIVTAERLSRDRQVGLADFVTRLRGGERSSKE